MASTGGSRTKGAPIVSIEAIPLAIPLIKPMIMGSERIERATNVVVRIETEAGDVGWGEATSAPTMTGDLQAGMVAAITDYLAPALIGADALELGAAAAVLHRRIHANHAAKAAVDMALFDLAGRIRDVPMVELLGGAGRDAVHPMWLLGNRTPEDDAKEAETKKAEGIAFFKLKVGTKTLSDDIRATHLVREVIGPGTALVADANMAWAVSDACAFVTAVGELGMLYLEQPVRDDDLDGMATVAKGPIPIAADEGIHGLESIEAHARTGAASGVGLKTIKFGGCARILEAAAICERLNMKINLACKVAESSIAAAGLVHLAAAMPSLDWGISISNHYLSDDLVMQPLLPQGGSVAVPAGPGLGVEVNIDQVEAYRV